MYQDKELVKLASSDDSKPEGGSADMDIYLSPGASTTVYICVQPSAKSDIYNKGQCRNFIGGLRVKVIISHNSEFFIDAIFRSGI